MFREFWKNSSQVSQKLFNKVKELISFPTMYELIRHLHKMFKECYKLFLRDGNNGNISPKKFQLHILTFLRLLLVVISIDHKICEEYEKYNKMVCDFWQLNIQLS
jgi:hypothetical protein